MYRMISNLYLLSLLSMDQLLWLDRTSTFLVGYFTISCQDRTSPDPCHPSFKKIPDCLRLLIGITLCLLRTRMQFSYKWSLVQRYALFSTPPIFFLPARGQFFVLPLQMSALPIVIRISQRQTMVPLYD